MHEDIPHLFNRAVAVNRRIDDGVVPEVETLLRPRIPFLGVAGVFAVEAGIGAERAEKGSLVVGRPAHPSERYLLQFGNRIPAFDEVLAGFRSEEKRMRHLPRPGVGQDADLVFLFVKPIVPARHHARRVSKSRVLRNVLDALAIDVNLASVPDAFKEFRTGIDTRRRRGRVARGSRSRCYCHRRSPPLCNRTDKRCCRTDPKTLVTLFRRGLRAELSALPDGTKGIVRYHPRHRFAYRLPRSRRMQMPKR